MDFKLGAYDSSRMLKANIKNDSGVGGAQKGKGVEEKGAMLGADNLSLLGGVPAADRQRAFSLFTMERTTASVSIQMHTDETGKMSVSIESTHTKEKLSVAYGIKTTKEAGEVEEGEEVEKDDYWSPESTATRIADFALSFFDLYKEREGVEDGDDSRMSFAEMIRESVNKGVKDAVGELGAVPDEIGSDIEKTHSLVNERIDKFIEEGDSRAATDISQSNSDGREYLARLGIITL